MWSFDYTNGASKGAPTSQWTEPSVNVMADAASRAWAPPFTNMWLSLRQGWTKDKVPLTHRKLYVTPSDSKAWHTALSRSTTPHDASGQPGVMHARSTGGSTETSPSTRNSSPCSPPTAGADHPSVAATPPTACCPRLALSRGIIEYTVGTQLASMPGISWPSTNHTTAFSGRAALVGFFYLLRSSEYLSVNEAVAPTALAHGDVILRDCRGRACADVDPAAVRRVDVRLRGSKTDQEGRSVVLSLERSGSGWLCPVLAVLDLFAFTKEHDLPPSAPLMAWSPGRVVRATSMIARLRVTATAYGIDPTRMGTHSMRSGGATVMMSAGVDLPAIKQFGRWASDSVDRYTRLTAAITKRLAARMAERAPGAQRSDAPQVGERCLGSSGL